MSLSPAPPGRPQALRNTSFNSTSISITWDPPTDNGNRSDIYYYVNTTSQSNGNIVNFYNTSNTFYELRNLVPLTTYTITITSRNGVSGQDLSNEADRQISINVTTMSSPPSSPQLLALERSSTGQSILTWSAPQNPYGDITRYNILVSEFNDSATATVRANVNGATFRFDLSQLDLESGSYFVWVSIG